MRRVPVLVLTLAAAALLGVFALMVFRGETGPEPSGSGPGEGSGKTAPGPEPARTAAPDGPLAGLNLTAYTTDGYGLPAARADIRRISALGATAITLTPTWYMASADADAIRPDPAKSPSDASLLRAARWIREAGLWLVLKPHVDVLDNTFRGEIQPRDRTRWLRSYRRFIRHYAAIAAERDAAVFVVGTELKSMSGDPAPWRDLIAGVRREFPGKLTYAANWDEYQQIRFQDDLDLIGVDAYFPLAEGTADPDEPTLVEAWKPVVDALRSASEQWDRPVLLTEVGYPSQPGATANPWAVIPGKPADARLQARAYRAVFRAFRDAPWLAGINWWSWRADPGPAERPATDYTPEGKPAEAELREGWTAPG